MNVRSQAILSGLGSVSAFYQNKPLNVVEVGCMFQEAEGLSTYVIADFLRSRRGGGRFISIENDESHIKACREIIHKRDPSLGEQIDYRHGHSLSVLPKVVEDLSLIHFYYLDGGAHPEVCLAEFEIAMANLAPEGVILVDDAQEISPSENYGLPRPLGKITLILPLLILANYLENREMVRKANSLSDDPESIPDSWFIGQVKDIDLSTAQNSSFAVIGSRHQMLLYGSADFLSDVVRLSAIEPRTTVRGRFRRLLKLLLSNTVSTFC
ncbi:O-methyltransferase [Candidatus Poribacteria bacterium]